VDCGLIPGKDKGLFVRWQDFLEFGIVFLMQRRWTWSITCGPLQPSVHGELQPWPTRLAHRSSASDRFGSPVLSGDSWGGGVGHGGLAPGLTRAREAVEQWRDGGEGGGGGALGAGSLRARRDGKEGLGRSGEERGCRGVLL
jgi:hypothetical protein